MQFHWQSSGHLWTNFCVCQLIKCQSTNCYQRDAILASVLIMGLCLFVCLSVCLSVTCRYCIETSARNELFWKHGLIPTTYPTLRLKEIGVSPKCSTSPLNFVPSPDLENLSTARTSVVNDRPACRTWRRWTQ